MDDLLQNEWNCAMITGRYARQTMFEGIGCEGAERIHAARVSIIGMGALGSVAAAQLARAGVGFLRIVDRDFVELGNLHRQALYTEENAGKQLPKAIAACGRLAAINSEIVIEPVVADFCRANAEEFVRDVDLILDGTDNFETRFLLNEICRKCGKPWIYGGAIGATGATMNILQDGGPCLRCMMPVLPMPGEYPTCATEGILGMASSIVASAQAVEALKIIVGSPNISRSFLRFDLWDNEVMRLDMVRDPDCAVCGKGEYELPPQGLTEGEEEERTIPLCADGTFQVSPKQRARIDLAAFAVRLEEIGMVSHNGYLLRFDNEEASFSLFDDGRAIIRDAKDAAKARSIYAEYIGL
ncbi:MAG: ThiF family adenylyltransferase [Synergistaceae bacterium]|nr:ThiF family adenylyltransferase [Synergistaceae bacterium]